MKQFSQLTIENRSSSAMLRSEIAAYINKVKKSLSYDLQKIIYLTQKYDLGSAEQLDDIRNSSKSKLKDLVDKYNIPLADLTSLWEMLKTAKKYIKQLPQYQTPAERQAIKDGKLTLSDLTIDLTTTQGRNAASKMYMPIVLKIINDYVGKSRLDKNSIMSAALLGMTNAMNDWKKEPEKPGDKVVPFKTYLAYRVKQQILNDINKYGHSLSGTNSYASKEYGASLLDAIRFDTLVDNVDKHDFIADEPFKEDQTLWNNLYKLIEKNFSTRDVDVFYRFFGLNGRKREKSKDIAKSYGMSEGNIRNSILNKILKWLRTNPKTKELLSDIQDMYTECLLCDLFGTEQHSVLEYLAQDDTYILLEEMNKWKNRSVFDNAYKKAIEFVGSEQAKNVIIDLLQGGFAEIDANLKKYKPEILKFLSYMYPTERFNNKSDVDLLQYMQEISDAYKKYKK